MAGACIVLDEALKRKKATGQCLGLSQIDNSRTWGGGIDVEAKTSHQPSITKPQRSGWNQSRGDRQEGA